MAFDEAQHPRDAQGRWTDVGDDRTKHARVVLKDGRRITVRMKGEAGRFLKGIEVNREGDEVTRPGVDERLHIIERSQIAKITPMVYDNKYGVLVDQGKQDRARETAASYRERSKEDAAAPAAASVANETEARIREVTHSNTVALEGWEKSYGAPKAYRQRYTHAFVEAWDKRRKALTGQGLIQNHLGAGTRWGNP